MRVSEIFLLGYLSEQKEEVVYVTCNIPLANMQENNKKGKREGKKNREG